MNNKPFYRRLGRKLTQGWRSLRRWMQLAVIALLLFILWFFFIHKSEGDEKTDKHGKNGGPIPVGVATVRTGDIHVYLNGLGTVIPKNIVTVHSRIDGELMKINFTEGQQVKEGDVLAEIDPRPYKAALDQAKGQIARDQALLKDARTNLDRYKTLFAQDSIAKQQLDTQASLVKQYEGAVQSDQGQVDNAKVQLAYTRITSPISGRVGLRQVDPGNIIHPGDTNGLVVVTQLQPITAVYALPEDNINAVMKHMQADNSLSVEAWSRDDKTQLAQGTLLAIDNQVDTTTGTVKFKAEFPNADNMLFANQFVNVHMLLDTIENATLIPAAGVQRGTQGTFVYLVKDDKTVGLQTITLGTAEGENVAITEGLKPGDQIVVDGGDSLRDEAKIQIAAIDGKPVEKPEGDKKADGEKKSDGEHKHHKKSEESETKGTP